MEMEGPWKILQSLVEFRRFEIDCVAERGIRYVGETVNAGYKYNYSGISPYEQVMQEYCSGIEYA